MQDHMKIKIKGYSNPHHTEEHTEKIGAESVARCLERQRSLQHDSTWEARASVTGLSVVGLAVEYLQPEGEKSLSHNHAVLCEVGIWSEPEPE